MYVAHFNLLAILCELQVLRIALLASFMCDFSVIDAALQVQNLRERPNMGRMAAVGD